MEYKLKDKVAIVTGGGSNIGRAIAIGFAREGATVVIAELDEQQGNKVAELIAGQQGKAKVIKTDVTDYESMQTMVKTAVAEFGKVDILVNNVGWDDFTPFIDNKPKWDKYINVNFRSVLNGMHCVLPIMIERKQGRIVNIGSDAGRIGEPFESVYSGCKAGVIGLSKSVAKEVGKHGITINVVCPGATPGQEGEVGKFSSFYREGETWAKLKQMMPPEREALLAKQFYPLRRLGKGEDIANAVLFFASEGANFITGQTISVSGGYTTL